MKEEPGGSIQASKRSGGGSFKYLALDCPIATFDSRSKEAVVAKCAGDVPDEYRLPSDEGRVVDTLRGTIMEGLPWASSCVSAPGVTITGECRRIRHTVLGELAADAVRPRGERFSEERMGRSEFSLLINDKTSPCALPNMVTQQKTLLVKRTVRR